MSVQTKDSAGSNVTIVNQKRSAVEGLVDSIQQYQDKRNELLTELAASKDSEQRAKLEEGVEHINEHKKGRPFYKGGLGNVA